VGKPIVVVSTLHYDDDAHFKSTHLWYYKCPSSLDFCHVFSALLEFCHHYISKANQNYGAEKCSVGDLGCCWLHTIVVCSIRTCQTWPSVYGVPVEAEE